MPIDIPKSRDEFMSLPIEQQRLVVKKLEFMSMPIEQQREVVAKLEDAQQTGAFEAAARGFGQGLTFNTLDEIIGGVKGGMRALGGEPLGQSVDEEIEFARRGFRKAERDQPFATGAGQVAGSVLPAIAAPVVGASKFAAGTLLGAGAKAVIPKTAAGRLGAGVAAGGVAGAGKSEEGVGSEEFRHSVQAGMAGGALGQAGFGLGKLVVGKTGKMAGGLTKAMGMVADKASKAGFIPKAVVGVAKKQIPSAMAKGFDKAIKLMEAGDLPANQAGILMQGLQSGGAGLATAYINLINNDVEFARAVEAGEVKPSPGKLGDFVPKAFTEKSDSTFSGRLQAGIDELFGVDQIGLDPGEKPFKGQPTDDDRIAMTLVPLFAGITKKVTSLNPEKIKELLEKKGKKLSGVDEERLRILNKPGMSQERKDRLIDRINEGIQGKGEGGVRDIPSGKMRYHDDTLEELTYKLDNTPRSHRDFAMIEGEIQRRLKVAKDGGIRMRKSDWRDLYNDFTKGLTTSEAESFHYADRSHEGFKSGKIKNIKNKQSLNWSKEYDDEDLGDAIDHINVQRNRFMEKGIRDVEFIKRQDEVEPEKLLPKSAFKDLKKGWLQEYPPEEWVSVIKKKFKREFNVDLKNLSDVIVIDDDVGDGMGRIHLAYGLGQKIPVSYFRGK